MIKDFAMRLPLWGWFSVAMVFYGCAEYLSKLWGYKPIMPLGILIVSCYATGSVCWLMIVLHKNEIARMGCIWQLVATALSVFVGLVLFGEKLNISQGIGAVLSFIGLYLLLK